MKYFFLAWLFLRVKLWFSCFIRKIKNLYFKRLRNSSKLGSDVTHLYYNNRTCNWFGLCLLDMVLSSRASLWYNFIVIGGGQGDTNLFPNVDSTWKVCEMLLLDFSLWVSIMSILLCCVMYSVTDIFTLIIYWSTF